MIHHIINFFLFWAMLACSDLNGPASIKDGNKNVQATTNPENGDATSEAQWWETTETTSSTAVDYETSDEPVSVGGAFLTCTQQGTTEVNNVNCKLKEPFGNTAMEAVLVMDGVATPLSPIMKEDGSFTVSVPLEKIASSATVKIRFIDPVSGAVQEHETPIEMPRFSLVWNDAAIQIGDALIQAGDVANEACGPLMGKKAFTFGIGWSFFGNAQFFAGQFARIYFAVPAPGAIVSITAKGVCGITKDGRAIIVTKSGAVVHNAMVGVGNSVITHNKFLTGGEYYVELSAPKGTDIWQWDYMFTAVEFLSNAPIALRAFQAPVRVPVQ
jgi:hypothetical protein